MSNSVTLWTVARHALLSMEISSQEYWSIPSPGDLPNPGMEPESPALQADSSPSEPHRASGETWVTCNDYYVLHDSTYKADYLLCFPKLPPVLHWRPSLAPSFGKTNCRHSARSEIRKRRHSHWRRWTYIYLSNSTEKKHASNHDIIKL